MQNLETTKTNWPQSKTSPPSTSVMISLWQSTRHVVFPFDVRLTYVITDYSTQSSWGHIRSSIRGMAYDQVADWNR